MGLGSSTEGTCTFERERAWGSIVSTNNSSLSRETTLIGDEIAFVREGIKVKGIGIIALNDEPGEYTFLEAQKIGVMSLAQGKLLKDFIASLDFQDRDPIFEEVLGFSNRATYWISGDSTVGSSNTRTGEFTPFGNVYTPGWENIGGAVKSSKLSVRRLLSA